MSFSARGLFSGSQPLTEASDRTAVQNGTTEARFTILEETMHTPDVQLCAQWVADTQAQIQALAQAHAQAQAQAQAQAKARVQAEYFRAVMAREGWSVSPNPWELPQRTWAAASDTYEAAVARVVAGHPVLSL